MVTPGQVARVLREPASLAGLILYGDDPGLVRARALTAIRALVGVEDDPFRVGILSRNDHGSLSEEATSPSLTGGRRVLRVLDAADSLVPALSKLPGINAALLILECAAFPRRSKLRVFAEKRSDWAAISCPPLAPAMIITEVQETLRCAGCRIQVDTLQTLSAALPVDSAGRQSEVEKIVTYAGPGGAVIDDQALTLCVNSADTALADLFSAVLIGDVDEAAVLVGRSQEGGLTGPGLIAAFSFHLHRLLKLRLLLDAGENASSACAMLLPPIYPKQAASMVRQASCWTYSGLHQVFMRVRQADKACKQAGSRDAVIAAQLMMTTARRVHGGPSLAGPLRRG